MTDTMRAAVFLGPREMELRDVPRPVAGPGEVLLKIAACAVCGTDLRIYSGGKTRGVSPPRVLGHEIAGVVVDIGPGAEQYTDVSLGDRVATPPGIPCLASRFCNSGHENLCQRRSALGYRYDGGFAEYMLVPAVGVQRGLIFRIPEALSDVEAALAEPLACVVNGQRKNGIVLGDVVLVIGAGPIGLMHLQLARLQGARKVLVSEPSAPPPGPGRRAGGDAHHRPHRHRSDRGGAGGDGRGRGGRDRGGASAWPRSTNTLLNVTRPGGRVNLFAGYSGTGEATIEANLIHYGELVVTGTNACTREDFRIALDLLAGGQLKAGPLVSATASRCERSRRAFETTRSGEGLRVVVEP